ncbi:hypothetical protein ACGF7U_31465 [Micromonospora sp. NPDC047670]|uniref:hypothetical protein n=1 Tax=Micromonospora sp. NPDC047670 TaxID=3364252 RepID=UPI00371564D5
MGEIKGGTVYDPYHGRNATWRPVGPVVDEYAHYTANSRDGYVCLGVVGDRRHWNLKNAGDHTSRSTHSTIVNGKTVSPKAGWVYAIDGRVPDPARFERWFAKQLRAGKYPHVKYWNILHRHYNRKRGWSTAVYSSDDHLHISFIPGSEHSDSSILADYERYRTGQPATPKPPATKPAQLVVDGRLGTRTITRWQQIMGTPVDGRITEPSALVKAVQRHLNAQIRAGLVVDGEGIRQDGRTYKTVRALQRYLDTEQDGIMSEPVSAVVRAVQRRLNSGKF